MQHAFCGCSSIVCWLCLSKLPLGLLTSINCCFKALCFMDAFSMRNGCMCLNYFAYSSTSTHNWVLHNWVLLPCCRLPSLDLLLCRVFMCPGPYMPSLPRGYVPRHYSIQFWATWMVNTRVLRKETPPHPAGIWQPPRSTTRRGQRMLRWCLCVCVTFIAQRSNIICKPLCVNFECLRLVLKLCQIGCRACRFALAQQHSHCSPDGIRGFGSN